MNRKFSSLLLLLIIFLIGTFLRFYNLGNVPNSMDWDEVSWGYNAYFVLITGKDEYGVSLPVSFKAFGDYKQPVYVYSEVIPVALFGLTPFAVRFPSAVYGSLSIILVYLFLSELFYKNEKKKAIALIASGIFAISPWSIQFSRLAFESTLGVFFVLGGLYLFLLGIRKNSVISFVFSAAAFALSAYSYHSEKLFMPLLLVFLLIIFRNYFFKRKLLTVFLAILIFIFNFLWISNWTTTARGASVLFTTQTTQLLKKSANEIIYDSSHGDKLGVLLNNRRIVYVNTFLLNYLKHLDPNWLFISGDLQRHHAPGMGLLYLISLPFIIWGIFRMFRDKYENRQIILIWFLLAPIASAIAIDAPNAERALIMLPPIVIWEAIGLTAFYEWCTALKKKTFIKYAALLVIACLYLFNFSYYVQQYFSHTNFDTQSFWQYGYQQVVEYTSEAQFNGKRIIFSPQFEQPYIFYLFYSKYNPKAYLANGGSNVKNNSCFSINNRYFGKCDKLLKPGDIYLTFSGNPPLPGRRLQTFSYLNGQTAAAVYEIIKK
jgi:4-amino-4-deoxy-L-arabinose transferase-like glycosyltransferase